MNKVVLIIQAEWDQKDYQVNPCLVAWLVNPWFLGLLKSEKIKR